MHLKVLTYFVIIILSAADFLVLLCPSLLIFSTYFLLCSTSWHTHIHTHIYVRRKLSSFFLAVGCLNMYDGRWVFFWSSLVPHNDTLPLNTLSVTGIYHCARVSLCVCVHPRKQESCCGLPNKQPGGTFLNRSACLCVSDRKPGGPSKACEWVFYWDKKTVLNSGISFLNYAYWEMFFLCSYFAICGVRALLVCFFKWSKI